MAAVAQVAPPPPADFDALFASVRQSDDEAYREAMDALQEQGLDLLGYAVTYYCKDAANERRKRAGEELNRRGAKQVDHDLVLALAHAQLTVRREATRHLVAYRTRGQDFGFNPSAAPGDRQRGLLKAVRWWENEYRDDFPEKARLREGAVIVVPVTGPVPVTPSAGTKPPAGATPAPPVPPQYDKPN
jgi:hypothetical protein